MIAILYLPLCLPLIAAYSTADLFERAQRLCQAAEITGEKVALTLADCRRLRLERRKWEVIWTASRALPDHILSCCSYCSRVRTPSGEWVAIPAEMSSKLASSRYVTLSHGICPDCLPADLRSL